MDKQKKSDKYNRIYNQLEGLLQKTKNTDARMATIIALLHHKMNYYFWTGFYFLCDEEMIVKMYQGAVACQILKKNTGVCWAAFNKKETVVVDDVHKFPGHIACDSRSKSEIVVPLRDNNGQIVGVLDVDSKEKSSFDEIDALWLEKILQLIYN